MFRKILIFILNLIKYIILFFLLYFIYSTILFKIIHSFIFPSKVLDDFISIWNSTVLSLILSTILSFITLYFGRNINIPTKKLRLFIINYLIITLIPFIITLIVLIFGKAFWFEFLLLLYYINIGGLFGNILLNLLFGFNNLAIKLIFILIIKAIIVYFYTNYLKIEKNKTIFISIIFVLWGLLIGYFSFQMLMSV